MSNTVTTYLLIISLAGSLAIEEYRLGKRFMSGCSTVLALVYAAKLLAQYL